MKRSFILILITTYLTTCLHAKIKPDESITCFPTYAYFTKKNTLSIYIHGWIYEQEQGSLKRKILLSAIRRFTGLKDEYKQNPILKQRSWPFMVDNERFKAISITLGEKIFNVGRSGSNGHFNSTISMKQSSVLRFAKNNSIPYNILLDKSDKRRITGTVHLVGKEGVSVISDIDDTIKISNVMNKKELIKNTFIRKFVPAPGMADIYKKWHSAGAAFHYVSGSPWQLFAPVKEFMVANKFPAGSIHLKNFRLKDSSAMKFIIADQMTHKINAIETILRDFPFRKFILVGDSGEHDPEVYTTIGQKYRNQILAIFIRDAGNPTGDSKRYIKLIKKTPDIKFILFKDSKEIDGAVSF